MRNMTKKRLGLIFVLLFAFLFGGFSWADSAKIAIVDTQKVLQESKAAKEARTSLLADIKKKRALFQRKQEEARQLQKELSRQSKDASPDALQEKREKLAQEVKSLKRLKVDMEEDLRRKNMELTKKILREIREVVKDYRKKKKYTVILEKKTVIAADDSIDITEQIIKLYDKKKK
ncbi:MAG: OmpH family outer membrane protein [Deltaproteobacteria bacterium]|nr:OmpH family outer membrane protein [Deltaproteobacteria bacterium]MBW1943805.1 OmpH family outer membrane protein [Deltaproteobacteria bacterium]MBW2206827.1 OmpH family outer membrane protein [Deltaproteobacteria bacterium]